MSPVIVLGLLGCRPTTAPQPAVGEPTRTVEVGPMSVRFAGPADAPIRVLVLPVFGEVDVDGATWLTPIRMPESLHARTYVAHREGYVSRTVSSSERDVVIPLGRAGEPDRAREDRVAHVGELAPLAPGGDVDVGRALYGDYCAACHGGASLGPLGQRGGFMAVPPLVGPLGFLARLEDEDLYATIRFGSFSGRCPKFGAVLGDAQIVSLIAYLRSGQFELDFATPPPEGPLPPKERPAVLLARGEQVYASLCVSCHQGDGKGIAGSVPPLAGSDFLARYDRVLDIAIDGVAGPLVVNGTEYATAPMPPPGLDDYDTAAALTWVYSQWGNDGRVVQPPEIAARR